MLPNHVMNVKDKAFVNASISAWFESRFEKDKSLLYISTAAIGLIFNMSVKTEQMSSCLILVAIFSSSFFLVTIVSVLLIFTFNGRYLERILNDNLDNLENSDNLMLKALDIISTTSFIFGVILIFLSSLAYLNDLREGVNTMSSKKNDVINLIPGPDGTVNNSLNGAVNLVKPASGKPKPKAKPKSTPKKGE